MRVGSVSNRGSSTLAGFEHRQRCRAPVPRPGPTPPSNPKRPFDPYDGTHTKAAVQAYLLKKYSLDGRAFSFQEQTYAVARALASNSDGRSRESESYASVARLYGTNFQRRYDPDARYLTSMDNFALSVALPWADVQSVKICGSDNGVPIYCVGVTRLPTFDSDAVAVTLGHFILVDTTDGARAIDQDLDGNWYPKPDLFAHELTHLDRGETMSHEDQDGVDDRQYWKLYGLGSWKAEERCAYQVGQDSDVDREHIVKCGELKP